MKLQSTCLDTALPNQDRVDKGWKQVRNSISGQNKMRAEPLVARGGLRQEWKAAGGKLDWVRLPDVLRGKRVCGELDLRRAGLAHGTARYLSVTGDGHRARFTVEAGAEGITTP